MRILTVTCNYDITNNYEAAALHDSVDYIRPILSPVHTSDADEPPTVGGTHFDAYEYLTGSYSGV